MKMKVHVIFLHNIWKKEKMNLFYKYEYEYKNNFFSHNKLKFQPRT